LALHLHFLDLAHWTWKKRVKWFQNWCATACIHWYIVSLVATWALHEKHWLVLCCSLSCETMVWWICMRRMNTWFWEKIVYKHKQSDILYTQLFSELNSSYPWLLRHWRDLEKPWVIEWNT
jgi:hypothetical protein